MIGPPGIATVPGWQLVSGAGTGAISFDRRFRGELAIAGAVRALRSGAPPIAVFVHSGAPGALRPAADRSDLAAAADALRSARFEVREWTPGEGAQPAAGGGRAIVWIIVPPAFRDGTDESPRERELLSAARRLVAQGQPVLLSVGPSLLPLLGQQDPWAEVLAGRGLRAETGRTILEVVPVGPDRAETSASQVLLGGESASAVGRAIDGQRVRLDRPVPLAAAQASAEVVATVEPSADRWVEDDWRRDVRARLSAPVSKRLAAPVPVVLAAETTGTDGARAARAVLVGSSNWMSTAVADAADQLGGGRAALRNPGNRELLVAAAAWLAGRDDLLSGTGAGREVARLPRLGRGSVVAVGVVEAVLVPAAVAAIGAGVVVRRRVRT